MTICLLLAAGSSSRMGEPKMLLPFNSKTLLQHIIDETKKLTDAQLLVVTGCYHSQLEEILLQHQIDHVLNKDWQEGMGSSIKKGIQYIIDKYNEANNVIILVCDQPYISAALLSQLISTKEQTGKGIVACTYNDTFGTPVLFTKNYFEQLALLNGQHGAKKIVQQFLNDTATVKFAMGAIDIDTAEDYNTLIKKPLQ